MYSTRFLYVYGENVHRFHLFRYYENNLSISNQTVENLIFLNKN